MTGERVFCSRFKRKVPTNLNPPATGVNVTAQGSSRDNAKEHIACRFSLIIGTW